MATLPIPTYPAYGDGATTYATRNLNALDQSIDNAQTVQDRVELDNTTKHGTGVIAGSYSGALLSAGAGLAVTVAIHKSLIGFVVNKTSAGTVALSASSTNHIWLYQDGVYAANTTGTNPGSASNPAIKLGTATTDAGSVTAVDNTRTEIVFAAGSMVEEFFTAGDGGAWDAAAGRTGGTAARYNHTLTHTPRAGTPVLVQVDRWMAVPTDDYTVTGKVVAMLDGAKPLSGEKMRVIYWR